MGLVGARWAPFTAKTRPNTLAPGRPPTTLSWCADQNGVQTTRAKRTGNRL